MARLPVVIDLETKYTFREKKEPYELEISVLGIYDYASSKAWIVREEKLPQVFPVLEKASYIIGYNIKNFDLKVLQRYYPGDVRNFSVFDIMEDIKEKIGKRIALDEVLYATLGVKKTGHGLLAVEYYRRGEWEALEKYCLDDVELTRRLFEFGAKKGKVFYPTAEGKKEVAVNWERILLDEGKSQMSLTLPF